MKLLNVKAMVAKVITAGLLAGALVMAAPVKAEAQQFGIGVRVGYPHEDYRYDRFRAEEFRRREAFVRHEEWVRAHEYRGYCHNAPYWYR